MANVLSSVRNLFARPGPAAIPIESNLADIEVSQIRPDPEQPRKDFDDHELLEMGQSLQQRQQQPIRLLYDHARPSQPWILIDGECRWRAARLVGKTTLQAICTREQLTRSEILRQQLVANLHRIDLKPMEQAQAFQQLMILQGFSEARELALYLSLSQGRISKALALLTAVPAVQQAVKDGELPASSGYELSRAPAEIQAVLAQKAVENGWNREHVRSEVRAATEVAAEVKGVSHPAPETPPPLTLHADDVGLPPLPDAPQETLFVYQVDDAEVVVRFPRLALEAEAVPVLELALGECRGKLPKPRIAA